MTDPVYRRFEKALVAYLKVARPGESVCDWVVVIGTEVPDEPIGLVSLAFRERQNSSITIELLARGSLPVARSQLGRESGVATPDQPHPPPLSDE